MRCRREGRKKSSRALVTMLVLVGVALLAHLARAMDDPPSVLMDEGRPREHVSGDHLRESRETAGVIRGASSAYLGERRPKTHVPHHQQASTATSASSGSSLGVEAFLSKIAVLVFFLLILLGFFIHVYCCHKTTPGGSYSRERRNPETRSSIRQHHHHHHHHHHREPAEEEGEGEGGGIYTITTIGTGGPVSYNDDKPPSYEEATGFRELDSPPPKYSRLFDSPLAASSSSSSLPSLSAATSTCFLTPNSDTETPNSANTGQVLTVQIASRELETEVTPERGSYSNAAFVYDNGERTRLSADQEADDVSCSGIVVVEEVESRVEDRATPRHGVTATQSSEIEDVNDHRTEVSEMVPSS